MDLPTKRLLTEDARAASIASAASSLSTSVPEDLTAQLRSIGSRVRKNVSEGYTTAPSRGAFVKAHTTGQLFLSGRDVLREVYAQPQVESGRDMQPPTSTKKRSRSLSGGDKERGDDDGTNIIDDDDEMQTDSRLSHSNEGALFGESRDSADRPMKPLRKPRQTVIVTRSLPAQSFRFSTTSGNHAMPEEDDWSLAVDDAPSFAPMMD